MIEHTQILKRDRQVSSGQTDSIYQAARGSGAFSLPSVHLWEGDLEQDEEQL